MEIFVAHLTALAPSAPVDFVLLPSTGQTASFSWREPATLNGDLGVYRLYVTSQTSSPIQFDYTLFVEQFTVAGTAHLHTFSSNT